jgi:hypothetical protein
MTEAYGAAPVARSVPYRSPEFNLNPGDTVATSRLVRRLTQATLGGCFLLIAAPGGAHGQVGISSGLAQVALVARIAPRASIQGVSAQQETAMGTRRDGSVTVSMSANSGYQLRVRATAASAARIWVRAANGEFQEVKVGSAVTVAKDAQCAGQWEREVQYRIEGQAGGAAPSAPLPVLYEIAVSPTL